jgi:predicted nucleic acid-binding protein
MSIYIDSNVFVYAVEGVHDTATPSKQLIASLRERRGLMRTSEITLAEVLAPSGRPGAWSLNAKRNPYLDLFVWSGVVALIPITRSILIDTADLRTGKKLKLPDAIHLVSAMAANCNFFVSGDADFGEMPEGMKHVRPNAQEIEDLLRIVA